MKLQRIISGTRRRGYRTALLSAAVASSLIFTVACGSDEEPPPEQPQETVEATQTTSATVTETEASETSEPTQTSESTSSSSTTRATGTRSNASDADENEELADARRKFGSLAPDSLFDSFKNCDPNGLQNSVACQGDQVGQFQFFESDAKAASTTQLLTELRSSRVVEDTGRKVVGWSTLGNTAIITVVDNDLGLVMQQMISTDEYDPRERIRELGLSDAVESDGSTEQTSEANASASASYNNADSETV